jgi:enoyl-CoA hydratase/carnithine racemase
LSAVERVRVTLDGVIARVTLARPDQHNGMDFAMLDAVRAAARRLRRDRQVRAIVLHGDGPSFCAGLDVKAVLGSRRTALAGFASLFSPVRNRFQDWSMAWRDIPVPVIAAVHGNCFGAGLQLALGADLRIAAPDARLSVMEVKWGLVPDMGGTVLLRELVRIDVAKELAMTGRVLTGTQAHAAGLVSHLDADPLAGALALAAEIVERSPDAVGAAKLLMQEAWSARESAALASERSWQRRVLGRANQKVAARRNTGHPAEPWRPRRF